MPYIERTVTAGPVRETLKTFTGRVHTAGATRGKNCGKTSKAQEKVNERLAEEKLRWKLNANFGAGDYHLVLHYYDKGTTLEKAEEDKREFLRLLRREYRKAGVAWKYVACTETERMTNVHHHVILPAAEVEIIAKTWERVVGLDGGNISIKPLDKRGNHAKLANYLIKETRSTVARYREIGKRYKRFTSAKGMEQPEPEYRVIHAATWAKEPKQRQGYVILKDDNGETVRCGVHEITGWPWMEYMELWVGTGAPPRAKRSRKTRRI